MTQQDLVLQLHEEGISAVAIHIRLVEVFGLLALVYLSMTRIVSGTSWTGNCPARQGRPSNEVFDELLFNALEEDPATSVCQIADRTQIAAATVFLILTNRLGFVSRKCRFVPHVLTETLQGRRLDKSIELLPILVHAKKETGNSF
jgi:hypothetical protein